MKTLVDQLIKEHKAIQKEYINYVLDRKGMCKDNEIKTRNDAKIFLEDIDLNDQYEATVWESGYLSWYHDAIQKVKELLS